jgi:transcriptional antiterminator RfaH
MSPAVTATDISTAIEPLDPGNGLPNFVRLAKPPEIMSATTLTTIEPSASPAEEWDGTEVAAACRQTPGERATTLSWYCVHTKPLKENQVATCLHERLGLETYFPRLKQQKTIRRVRRVVTGPLFPRYLFCRFDLFTRYRAVRYAPEVVEVVSFGERPTLVRDTMIEELKSWAGEAVDVITLRPDLQPGDMVEITDGPMRGLQAVILHERNDRDRVAVLLSILECGAQMMISRSQLARVN